MVFLNDIKKIDVSWSRGVSHICSYFLESLCVSKSKEIVFHYEDKGLYDSISGEFLEIRIL